MKKTNFISKSLSLLLALALTMSLMVAPASAAVKVTDMYPKDDPDLGISYNVDAIVSLSADQKFSVDIPVSGKTLEQVNAAIAAGKVALSLVRDASKPYANPVLYPNMKDGGALESWKTQGGTPMFDNVKMSASTKNGKVVLTVTSDINCYFYKTDWYGNVSDTVDYSVPHTNGGSYLDNCGYFNLSASVDGSKVGSSLVKVAPYENFHTMWEIYKDLETVAANGAKNGLYTKLASMGKSTAGREMPYLIVADSKATVDAWLALKEKAEANPTAVLADIAKGKYDDIRLPVLYSNVHSNETAATDGVMKFAEMITSQKSISYKTLTGFTAEGKAELATEMGPVGEAGSVAIPDLVKDSASYLGYLTVDNNGKSGKVDLAKYYTSKNQTISVKDELLSDVFFILVPEENVDGRTYLTRQSSNGYDLNRDNSFQTTSETANMQSLICAYNPVSFAEFHGRVTAFQCEPCDPPHEPNFEYDLLAEHLIPGGEALGIAAVANNDEYNSYVIPQRDYLEYTGNGKETYWADPWDDMSTSYTPQFAMLHGAVAYTVELPAYCDSTAQAVSYGILGNAAYVAAEKIDYLTAQVKIFERGVTNFNSDAFELVGQWLCDQYDVEGAEMDIFRPEFNGKGQNGNFYPECYIIPMDGVNQSNLQAASDMMEWLTRNGVKANLTTASFTYNGVTYPKGTLVISMYQAKRSVANGALYDGTLINGWTVLYSEGITSFNETRGFDMVTVAEPAAYKTIKAVCGVDMDHDDTVAFLKGFTSYFTGVVGADVIISNVSEDSTAAVNTLLKAGKTVGFITDGANKGDFICSYADYLTVSKNYILSATGVYGAGINAKIIKNPTVYLTGTPGTASSGFVYNPQVSSANSWNYDRVAMEAMNFTVTESLKKATVVVGSSALNDAAKAAVKEGMPYIGYSKSAVTAAADLLPGTTYTGLSGAMDCLAYVTYPDETLVNTSYIADGDDVMYGYGFGYFSAVPKDADVLVKVDGKKTPTEGFIPTNTADRLKAYNDFLKNGILGFSYSDGTLNVALFANTLTNKGHQRDEYAFISNFVFSSNLSEKDYVGMVEGAKTFADVDANAYYAPAVAWAVASGITTGTSDTTFAPNVACTRGQVVTFLWRAMGCPEPTKAATFTDVDASAYYAKAVAWAAENGITTGATATAFAPNATVTRAQFVTFLYRSEKVAGKDLSVGEDTNILSYNDAFSVPSYAISAFQWACGAGVVQGDGSNLLSTNPCTRGQVVTFLYRDLAN
ncbi:MAG: M14 family metallopeptidase [Oscillibacter sp.]|nr:M14 family metallopeptidase [Oscillibacter sp.]